ncbi:neutral phospholipase A2 agkistrodotoxin-like [Mizuhopecten yessoensis]|uniref:Phospholipase A2 n=1 Tax=Mizuhopecten yessoensis TaxID=6573 RepID=A0A210Q6V2_MIZYE|nr:neutral phospholipase A2 agkistrodotoxin-like [Mizuhopecten yessoensis]OWF44445.1 Basic phospholipase A2 Bs-N6 [Mizuhopecten yessoensis]
MDWSVRHAVIGVIFLVAVVSGERAHRWRRSLPQLNKMIRTVTGKSGLDFNGYGNWCGVGGSGEPVDEIDRCCKAHDLCYDNIATKACKSAKGEILTTYTTIYNWTLTNGHLQCNDVFPCQHALCMCDRQATTCFALNLASYDNGKRSRIGILIGKLLAF